MTDAKMAAEVKRLEVQNRELARQLIRNAALCGELEAQIRSANLPGRPDECPQCGTPVP